MCERVRDCAEERKSESGCVRVGERERGRGERKNGVREGEK